MSEGPLALRVSKTSGLHTWAPHLGVTGQDLSPGSDTSGVPSSCWTPEVTPRLDLVCSPSRAFSAICSLQHSGFRLVYISSSPTSSLLNGNCLPGRKPAIWFRMLIFFFKEFLGSLKRPPFSSRFSGSPPWGRAAYLSYKHPRQAQGRGDGLSDNQESLSVYTYALSLVVCVDWKHPVQMMQKVVTFPHSL